MLVQVRLGNQIIAQGGTKMDVKKHELLKFIKSSTNLTRDQILNLVDEDYDLIYEILDGLNPKLDYFDCILQWRLSSICDFSIRPNFGKYFAEEFFPTGFICGDMYVLSAISGGGKTSMGIQIATTLATGKNFYSDLKKETKACVFYVSLEQNKKQIEARVIANLSAIYLGKPILSYSGILSGQDTFSNEFSNALLIYSTIQNNLRILDFDYFNKTPTVEELCMALEHELSALPKNMKKLVIVDRYENIIGGTSNNDDKVARELKNFAVKENVPILVQAQMSKNAIESAKTSDGKFNVDKLSASSLKGTSGLEHHASGVMILVPDNVMSGESKRITLIQPKNRYGKNESMKFNFLGTCGLFTQHVETRGRKKKENLEDDSQISNLD